MKTKLGLLLFIPALLLSSCGPKKVSYAEFKAKADEAVSKGETVKVTGLTLDNSGKMENKDFKVHEVYTTVDGTLTLKEDECKYEGEATVQLAARIVSALALAIKANAVTEEEKCQYAINPLTVYEDDENAKAEMSFDDYGNLTKLDTHNKAEEGKATYKLIVKYTYEKK